jgi:hypothetical protein
MSVLCRHPDTKDAATSADIYPFEQFRTTCGELARLVRPRGYLVIYNANYRFTDAEAAKGFSVVTLGSTESGFVVKFDRDGTRSGAQSYAHCVFQKDPFVEG